MWAFSQENRKSGKETADENESSINMTHFEGVSSSSTGGLVGLHRSGRGGTCRSSGRGSGGDIDALGVLSTARVVGAAGGRTGTGGALVDTFGICLGADKVGHCLGVLGCIGRDIVAADARVAQGILLKMISYVGNEARVVNETHSIAGIFCWRSGGSWKL